MWRYTCCPTASVAVRMWRWPWGTYRRLWSIPATIGTLIVAHLGRWVCFLRTRNLKTQINEHFQSSVHQTAVEVVYCWGSQTRWGGQVGSKRPNCWTALGDIRIWAMYVVRVWENRNAYRVLVGKHIRKQQLGRSRGRWEDNIKLDLKEIRWVAYVGFIWIRIRESGELLWMRSWTSGLHKVTGISGRLIKLVNCARTLFHGISELVGFWGDQFEHRPITLSLDVSILEHYAAYIGS